MKEILCRKGSQSSGLNAGVIYLHLDVLVYQFLFVYVSYMFVCSSVYFFYLIILLSARLFYVCLFICSSGLSVYLFTCSSVRLFICFSEYLFICFTLTSVRTASA